MLPQVFCFNGVEKGKVGVKWIDNNLRNVNPLSANPQKLSKHNQTIRRPQPHFVGLALKGLKIFVNWVKCKW